MQLTQKIREAGGGCVRTHCVCTTYPLILLHPLQNMFAYHVEGEMFGSYLLKTHLLLPE